MLQSIQALIITLTLTAFTFADIFITEISDPQKVAEWWDDFFTEIHHKYPKIRKGSSNFRIKLRLLFILIANRLYLKKIKRIGQSK